MQESKVTVSGAKPHRRLASGSVTIWSKTALHNNLHSSQVRMSGTEVTPFEKFYIFVLNKIEL